MAHRSFRRLTAVFLSAIAVATAPAQAMRGSVETHTLRSQVLQGTRTGLNPERTVKVYLPPSYATSGRAYPVVYYLHNINWSPENAFRDGNLVRLIESGFERGAVREFIFVVADFTSPTIGSLFENSPTSGRWLDFITGELVPFVDGKFRTLPRAESRAVAGDFMGGRGALKLGMTHADVFSVVYALHPVATGPGSLPWNGLGINWERVHSAKTFAELAGPGRDQIFVAICQAFLPNPDRPPFYCDFFIEPKDGKMQIDPVKMRKAQIAFMLDGTLDAGADNLRKLRGLAFDWGRFDPTPAHVISNREFSRLLEDLAIEHEAEEFRGDAWNRIWTPDGRFATRLLPFVNRYLVFDASR